MARHIALLRGINVGASRRIAMADLRVALTAAGFDDVQTYLQSGNVLLGSDAAADLVRVELERVIEERFGFAVPVVVRSREQLAAVVERDPIPGVAATDPKRYQVTFLGGELAPAVARELASSDFSPDLLVVDGREIFAWHPAGAGDSKLAKRLTDRYLGVTATARNWTTVTALAELARD